jgi:hypothetical protein
LEGKVFVGAFLRKTLCVIVCGLIGLILHGWSAGALYYCIFPARSGYQVLPAALYLAAVILFIVLRKRHLQAFLLSLLGFVLVAAWFNTIQPKAGGIYPPELTLPFAEFHKDVVTIHNVRNCAYRTTQDFDLHYETRSYDLKDLRTLDVMVNYWGMSAIAHTFLSFGFSDGEYLAVSVEIRPEVGKAYSMLRGFFKQYQLIYIWGDERDLVRLRTNTKKEEVYLYRSTLPPDEVRRMFVDMLQTTSSMHENPQFYNTLTHSCTNTLGNHLIAAKILKIPLWKRRFLTGDVDQRLYNEGLLDTSIPFKELRSQAHINSRALKADQDTDFSKKIRTHLNR